MMTASKMESSSEAHPSLAGHLMLDKANPMPLYLQLAASLLDAIKLGLLASGDQLPPERDLAEMAGVSRMTARQSLAQLERNGTLDVRHGVGTFVADRKLVYDAVRLQAFSESASLSGTSATTRLLRLEIMSPPADISAQLELGSGDQVIVISRLRVVDDEPLLLERSCLRASRFASLLDEDLKEQSLYALLASNFDIQLTHAHETVEAAQAGDADGALLGVAPTAPTLVVSGVAFQAMTPIEHFRAVYRADRVKLAINSERRPGYETSNANPRVSMVLS
jgi:GntR family transcriptional regulator